MSKISTERFGRCGAPLTPSNNCGESAAESAPQPINWKEENPPSLQRICAELNSSCIIMGKTNDNTAATGFSFRRLLSEQSSDGRDEASGPTGDSPRLSPHRFLRTLDPRRRRDRSRSVDERSDASKERDSHILSKRVQPAQAVGDAEGADGQQAVDVTHSTTNIGPASSVSGAVSRPLAQLSATGLNVSMELWNEAYDRLGEANPEMRVIYEKILSSQLTTGTKYSATMGSIHGEVTNCRRSYYCSSDLEHHQPVHQLRAGYPSGKDERRHRQGTGQDSAALDH